MRQGCVGAASGIGNNKSGQVPGRLRRQAGHTGANLFEKNILKILSSFINYKLKSIFLKENT